MVLHTKIVHMRFYFIFVIFFASAHYSYAEGTQSNNTIKSLIIEEIKKKVSNITLNTLSKASPQKKESILNKIENKLRKSAKAVGPDAQKYVKFIMEEFKTKAFDEDKKDVSQVIRKSIHVRSPENSPGLVNSETKQEIIKEISLKVQSLAKGLMKNADTLQKKKEILENIKHRILNSAQQRHEQIHNKHEELKAYSSLIEDGLEVSMRKMLEEDTDARPWENAEIKSLEEMTPLLGELDVTDLNNPKTDKNVEEDMTDRNDIVIEQHEIDKYQNFISQSLNDTSLNPICDEIVEETCLNIQAIKKISCGDGQFVPIESLCNGVIDCFTRIDEGNCTVQVMEKVQKANEVMSDVEASLNQKCFAKSVGGHLLTTQNLILHDVLQTQMEFLNKGTNDIFTKRTVADIVSILSTLAYALDGTLCAHPNDQEKTGIKPARKYNDVLDEFEDEKSRDPNWSPKSCICKGQFCKDLECDAACKRVCWQKYSLSHWACEAINGGTSVTINVLCDGKLDCFDETDEINCAMGSKSFKIEASSTYSNLLDLLSTKSKSYEFLKTRNKLVALHDLVRQLQKHTMKINPDTHTVKIFRDESFKLLASIFDDLLQSSKLEEIDDIYLTLLSMNEKLVTALKSSNTGNENFISPEGCYCRGGVCALRRCTKHCVQSCLAEPLLTQFSCDTDNITVPLQTICNGRNNCPNGEDEKDCMKEVCRGHHIVMLRHNLQNVGLKHRSSILGEVLETWKAKVSASLFIAETTERPNHRSMLDLITKVLHDLVMAFAAMEDYRRMNSETALQEFKAISKIVIQTLKSCGN